MDSVKGGGQLILNAQSRRPGVLLLIVVCTLTLFLMLGATYLAVARRARMASKAFADNITAVSAAGIAERRRVDEAFFAVVRGTNAAAAPVALRTGDDLLGDKYGQQPPATARVTAVSQVEGSDSLLRLTLPGPPWTGFEFGAELNGRVITFLMPGLVASTRILQATGGITSPPVEIVIAAGPTISGADINRTILDEAIQASTDASTDDNIVINGREFSGATGTDSNEPYDAFDAENPLLAQIIPAENGVADNNGDGDSDDGEDVNLAPLYGSTPLDLVDNDADGIADSAFIDIGLPSVLSPTGRLAYPRAAILVTDLDGRLNLNVHGTAVDGDLIDPVSELEMYPPDAADVTQYHLPRGLATGPAAVSITRGLLFENPNIPSQTEVELTDKALASFSGIEQTSKSSDEDRLTVREVPNISGTQGRYGGSIITANATDPNYLANAPRPGFNGVNDNGGIAQSPDRWRAGLIFDPDLSTWVADDYFRNPGRYGSPFDFKGRLRVWADPPTGQPVFYKPYWDRDKAISPPVAYDNELVDDPYEVNFRRGASQQGTPNAGTSAADNLFSAADLEGLIRYFDSDSLKLNRRLVTLLGSVASANRLTVTTESWDTPAVVGSEWRDVIGPFAAGISDATSATRAIYPGPYSRVQDVFAPETLMGLKLDLNRPFHDAPEDVNGNGVLDLGEDLDGNGWLDAEPNDATGLERRQLLAQQLYCLMIAIAEANGPTPTAEEAEQIAQYAVNIVDFRDADSVMTPFDYDKDFGGGSTDWTPTQRVWGCERPELLITEAIAWHDRNQDFLVGPPASFEQRRRPEGSFFVEITRPWATKAKEYDVVSGNLKHVQRNASNCRAQPIPCEFAQSISDRFKESAALDLAKVGAGGDPIWRVVSTIDRPNATPAAPTFGADFLHGGTNWILEQKKGGVPVDRAFYFTEPANDHDISDRNKIFWPETAAGKNPSGFYPSPDAHVTIGTPARGYPFGVEGQPDIAFVGQYDQFGTLTEPIALGIADVYDELFRALVPTADYNEGLDPRDGTTVNKNFGSWTVPYGASHNNADGALDAHHPDAELAAVLIENGTHRNFFTIQLQRLALPHRSWHEDDNPYVTVDSMPVDLTVVNTDAGANYDMADAGGLANKAYILEGSVERGGKNQIPDPLEASDDRIFDLWSASPNERAQDFDPSNGENFVTSATIGRSVSANGLSTLQPTGGAGEPVYKNAGSHTYGGPPAAGSGAFPWLYFQNRPFCTVAELAMVPTVAAFRLTRSHTCGKTTSKPFNHLPRFLEEAIDSPWDELFARGTSGVNSLLDFVHVPSPYVGLRNTVPLTPSTNSTALENQLGLDVLPLEQISTFREPGRVNVNTITDSRVWRSLFGSLKAQGDPDVAGLVACDALPGFSANIFGLTALDDDGNFLIRSSRAIFEYLPARNTATRQASASDGGFRDSFSESHRDTDMHPYFRYQTRMQLENLVTVRSNVYAIWVTIGYFDAQSGGNEITPIKRNRGFYIFDRSIPVAYERGKDHNVRDAILLRRIIQ